MIETAKHRVRVGGVAASALLVAILGYGALRGASPGPPDQAAGPIVQRGPAVKVDFALPDVTGRPFHFGRETDGTVALVFFGYTSCPDVCPITLATLAAVLRDLPVDQRLRVKLVFVAVDPERDTPARVGAWLARLDPAFIGLVGSREAVTGVQRSLGLTPAPSAGPGGTIGHAAQVIIFSPDGRVREDHPFGARQVDWARTLARLLATPGPTPQVERPSGDRVVARVLGAAARGAIEVSGVRATSADAGGVAAAYLMVQNHGSSADALIGVETEAAESVEVHGTVRRGGTLFMERVGRLSLAPGQRRALVPGDAHLMLVGVRRALHEGDRVAFVLRFERAGLVAVDATVQGLLTAGGPAPWTPRRPGSAA